ncbi:MAG: hypothetical protein LBC37_00330 [Zoogloeaceae bacterium]|nr:hypothetical protein [Zoogloeaceae bacterium]
MSPWGDVAVFWALWALCVVWRGFRAGCARYAVDGFCGRVFGALSENLEKILKNTTVSLARIGVVSPLTMRSRALVVSGKRMLPEKQACFSFFKFEGGYAK